MPYKLKKACSYPLCLELIPKGQMYCYRHKDKKPKREYTEDYKRGWLALRSMYLKHNPLCEDCKDKEIVEAAIEVHHKISIEVWPEGRLVWDNLRSLCKSCHSKKTAKEKLKE